MGSIVQGKPWQDVVAEKQRLKAESLARFAPQGDDSLESNGGEGRLASANTESVQGTELVDRLARGELSCESLIQSHVEKSVRIMRNCNPSQQKPY